MRAFIFISLFLFNVSFINGITLDKLNSEPVKLYYDKNGSHYKTIGLKKKEDKFQTIFKRSKLPEEINRILDKQSFLSFHIENICNNDPQNCGKSKLHLNYILNKLEERLGVKISRNDKKNVMEIIMKMNL